MAYESKKDEMEELKYMRKGGAPKSVLKKEEKEHEEEMPKLMKEAKSKGYRNGGKVMKAPMGGQNTPGGYSTGYKDGGAVSGAKCIGYRGSLSGKDMRK